MSESQIFSTRRVRQDLARAARRRKGSPSFLECRALEDAVERVSDINRKFENALLIASPGSAELFTAALPVDKRPREMVTAWPIGRPGHAPDIIVDPEALPFGEGRFDLIVSIFGLQSVNDMPGALARLQRALVPDGWMGNCVIGGESLRELRESFYRVDAAYLGGPSPRVHPLLDHTRAAGLMSMTGFNQAVVDIDRVNVAYRDPAKLIEDLRDLGVGNALLARERTRLPKSARAELLNGLDATVFEILWMSGWSPHPSQQKPLERGSAKMGLAEGIARAAISSTPI